MISSPFLTLNIKHNLLTRHNKKRVQGGGGGEIGRIISTTDPVPGVARGGQLMALVSVMLNACVSCHGISPK